MEKTIKVNNSHKCFDTKMQKDNNNFHIENVKKERLNYSRDESFNSNDLNLENDRKLKIEDLNVIYVNKGNHRQ